MTSDDDPYPTAVIGPLIKRRRTECGMTQTDLARRLSQSTVPRRRRWTNQSISRIESEQRSKWARQWITRRDVKAIAAAIGIPFTELLPATDMTPYTLLDPIKQADEALGFRTVLEHEGRQITNALVGWGEFLPCSLETESFLKAHHAAIFDQDRLGYPEALCTRAMSVFNEIGLAQLERFHKTAVQRPWVFKHLMFADDMQRIVNGDDEFSSIPRAVRRDCIDKLAAIIEDRRYKVELWIADRAKVPQPVQIEFDSIDSLVSLDRRFAFWRSHLRQIHHTDDAKIVEQKCQSLDRFLAHAEKWDSASLRGLLKNS